MPLASPFSKNRKKTFIKGLGAPPASTSLEEDDIVPPPPEDDVAEASTGAGATTPIAQQTQTQPIQQQLLPLQQPQQPQQPQQTQQQQQQPLNASGAQPAFVKTSPFVGPVQVLSYDLVPIEDDDGDDDVNTKPLAAADASTVPITTNTNNGSALGDANNAPPPQPAASVVASNNGDIASPPAGIKEQLLRESIVDIQPIDNTLRPKKKLNGSIYEDVDARKALTLCLGVQLQSGFWRAVRSHTHTHTHTHAHMRSAGATLVREWQ